MDASTVLCCADGWFWSTSNVRAVVFGSHCCHRDKTSLYTDADYVNRGNRVNRVNRECPEVRVVRDAHVARDVHVHWHSIQRRHRDRDAELGWHWSWTWFRSHYCCARVAACHRGPSAIQFPTAPISISVLDDSHRCHCSLLAMFEPNDR